MSSLMKARTVSAAPTKRVGMSDLHQALILPIEDHVLSLVSQLVMSAARDESRVVSSDGIREFRRKMRAIDRAEDRAIKAVNDLLRIS